MPATYSPLSSLSEQPGLWAAVLRGSERTRRRSVSFLLSFSFPFPLLTSSFPHSLICSTNISGPLPWHCTGPEEATGGMDFDILEP